MAFVREWVQPSNFLTRLGNLLDDGTDYEIIFDNGVYSLTGALHITFRNGGHIVLRSHLSHQAILTTPSGVSQQIIHLNAEKIGVHGFHLLGTPFSAVHTATTSGARFFLSGVVDTSGDPPVSTQDYSLNFPTEIHVTDLKMEGWGAACVIKGSQHPSVYTDIFVAGNEHIDSSPSSITGQFEATLGLGHDCFAHIVLEGNKGVNRNGPLQPQSPNNGLTGDGPAWGGEQAIHHNSNTIFYEINHLAGDSTYLEIGSDFTAELYGSENHDMHCERVHFIKSKDVEMHWKDCQFKGNWRAGHGHGDGGGNFWVWYYHTGAADYPTFVESDRPHLQFDNCLFRTTYYEGVPHDDIVVDPGAGFSTAQCQSSATYDFFDCRFEIIDDANISANPQATAGNALVGIVAWCLDPQPARVTALNLHNCSYILPEFTTHPTVEARINNEAGCAAAVRITDLNTLGFGPTDFHRNVGVERKDAISTYVTGFNGDCEIDTDDDDIPDNWTVVAHAPAAYLTTEIAHPSILPIEHGPHAMRFRGQEGSVPSREDEAYITIPATSVFLVGGQQFWWSYWGNAIDARNQPLNPINFEVHTQFDSDGWVLAETYTGDDRPFGWFRQVFTLTPSVIKANFHIRFRTVVVGGMPSGLHVENYWVDLIECRVLGV